jgi:hypothetical protein
MSDNLKNKLLNYEAEPPATAWNGIAAALDEQPEYAQKLHRFEVSPPPAVWDAIVQQLPAAPSNVVPFHATKLFKYALAAAILIAIAASSVIFFRNSTDSDLANGTVQPTTDSNRNTQPSASFPNVSTQATNPDADVLTANEANTTKNIYENAVVQFSPRVRIAKSRFITQGITVVPEEKSGINTELPSRYMIATTATGDVVRLPKKAYSDYACANVYANYRCKEKIASIQSKMAASVAVDFTDVMNLLEDLQDN